MSLETGRRYYLSCSDASDALWAIEDDAYNRLTAEEKASGADKNIHGLFNYLNFGVKRVNPRPIRFSRVDSLLDEGDLTYGQKRLGMFHFAMNDTEFDLVRGSSGEIIIPRKTPALELRVQGVIFPRKSAATITPNMISHSLGLIADYISTRSDFPKFVFGLTHPRMGNIAAKRWGFTLEERPFPPEIYQLLDMGIQDKQTDPDAISSVRTFRDQVLVYKTGTDFINDRGNKKPSR